MNETKESAPKLGKRELPTPDQFPIYLKVVGMGKIDPKSINKCIYKLTGPRDYMMASVINTSVDVRIRCYDKVNANVFDEYLAGSPEYKVVTFDEFEKLLLEVNETMLAYARQGVVI